MADPPARPRRRWLRWVGLDPPRQTPADPDAWTPVASGLLVDDVETGHCEAAAQITAALAGGGVPSHQRVYVVQDDISLGRAGLRLLGPGPPAADRIRMAVVVHNRDLARARELLGRRPADPETGMVEQDAPGNN